jgi:hypothetical protein
MKISGELSLKAIFLLPRCSLADPDVKVFRAHGKAIISKEYIYLANEIRVGGREMYNTGNTSPWTYPFPETCTIRRLIFKFITSTP